MAAETEKETVGVARWLVTIGAIGVYFAARTLQLPSVVYTNPSFGGLSLLPEGSPMGMSLFALGVTPVISALLFTEVARLAFPPLAHWTARGPRQATLYLRIVRALALGFAAMQALGVAAGLEAAQVVFDSGWPFQLEVVAAFVGATSVLIWLADLINTRGVGDGLVLLYAAPLAAHLPPQTASWWKLGAFLPAFVPILLLALTLLSIAALIAVSRRGSKSGPLDLWSLLLGGLLLQWIGSLIGVGPFATSLGTHLVGVITELSGDEPAPIWILALNTIGVAAHILVAAGLFSIAALRRAHVDQVRLDTAALLLLTSEFVVWLGAQLIAELSPAPLAYSFGFTIIFCVAAALSVLPPWRGGRALAPG
jgi:hypothetical protein